MEDNPAVNAEDIDAAPAVCVDALVGNVESLSPISRPSRTGIASHVPRLIALAACKRSS